jgi:tetratricopeptide (TPR) repeat protein
VRTLRCPYEDFYSGVVAKTSGVIFEEMDATGTLLYSTHHRIVAQRIADMFFGEVRIQKSLLLELLREAHLGIEKEKEIVEKLMIRYLGPRSPRSRFSIDDKIEFFEAVCKGNPIRSLLHHYGILETDAGNFDLAEGLLKKALSSRRSYLLGGESDRNILTSLGRLYSKLAQKLSKEGDITGSEEKFAKAEETFMHARYAGPTNAYPYHAHATMYREKAQIAQDSATKLQLLGEALAILEVAEDNINEFELKPIYEIKTMIYSDVGDVSKVKENILVLKEKYKSARGYWIYADILYNQALNSRERVDRGLLEEALEVTEEGLSEFPDDEACARLQAKIIEQLDPSNLVKRYEALRNWYNISGSQKPNIWLLYRLGVLAFNLGHYYDSEQYFRFLEKVSVGHRRRFDESSVAKDHNGALKEFEGVVSRVENPYQGEIECTGSGNVKFRVHFRPIRCTFTPQPGDLVNLHIAFTFLGPSALDIRKM